MLKLIDNISDEIKIKYISINKSKIWLALFVYDYKNGALNKCVLCTILKLQRRCSLDD